MRSELECENRDFLEFLSSQIERQDLVGLEAFGVHSVFLSIRGGEFTEVDLAWFYWRASHVGEADVVRVQGGCDIAERLALRCLGLGK